MNSKWEEVALKDIVEFLNAKRIPLSSKVRENRKGVYPYYGASGIVDYLDNYIFDGTYLLISEDGENLKTRKTPIAFIAEGKYWVNNHAHILDEKDDGILVYLKYYFSVLNIKPYLTGAVQPKLNKRTLSEIPIRLAPRETRLKINYILSTLDDKIELNRKMNETLEAMAQAMFKSWFVDFDPVHAKAVAKTEAELDQAAKTLGISREILDFFPSKFVESEMGLISEGWEVKPFGELLSKTIGGDWGKDEPDDKHTEKVKIIRGTDIPKIKNISIEAVPTRYIEAKKLKTRELFDGDIVIEVSGGTKNQPTGRTLYVTNEVLEMLGNKVEPASFCRLFRPINIEVGLVLGQHMLYIYDQGKTWQYQNQSTGISNFQTTIFLEKEHVVVPDAKVLTEFYKIVRPLIEKSLSSESITLQKTRDTLLPKLLSGELDISNLEVN